MNFGPILSALSRHRLAATLIALEIALACAVLCNACFLVAGRLQLMHIDSGVDTSRLATVALRGCDGCTDADLNARVLQALRQLPGVQAAGVANALPFTERAGDAGITLDAEGQHFAGVPHYYLLDPGAIQALDLHPIEGRRFADDDFRALDNFLPADAQVWVTRALADHLWPGQSALGKEFWTGSNHFRVAGVLAHLARPDPGRSESGIAGAEWSIVVPVSSNAQAGRYVLRADPVDLPRLATLARARVEQAVPEAVLDEEQSRSLDSLRVDYFQRDRAMAWLLAAVAATMLAVTALGIIGLASFWVQQRTKQIGIRRALGATRRDILRYFQTENFLIVGAGIVLGMLLAYGGNLALMNVFELGRLPWPYLPIGALALLLVGQLAVLGPALRAARVPPAVATRTA